jgi:hypothetical protein
MVKTAPAYLILAFAVVFYSAGLCAAEQPPNEPATAADAAETDRDNPVSEAAADPKPPEDTLDGAGLKEKKLSDIFEQFVPTETISADNAVPFPVDI